MLFAPIGESSLVLAILPLLPAAGSLFLVVAVALLGLAGAALRFRPGAIPLLARAIWRQKPSLIVLGSLMVAGVWLFEELTRGSSPRELPVQSVSGSWPMFRGTLQRTGHGDEMAGPTRGSMKWVGGRGYQFYASPALVDNQIIAIGSQGDSARIFSWQAESGTLQWSVAPRGHRATLSSPVFANGYLYCGEGFHRTENSRLFCFDWKNTARPELASQFSTAGHVECTPVVADGRIYFGAGDDGIYCLEQTRGNAAKLRAVWHAPGDQFPDVETALAVHEGRVYVGLGFGGEALCVLDAATGRELARVKTPHPVFSPPAIDRGRLYLGMGAATYLSHEPGKPGEVRCIDLATLQTLWRVETAAAVLTAIVADDDDVLFNTVAGEVFVVDRQGGLKHRWNAGSRMISAPAVTDQMIYCVACDGNLTALDRALERVWSLRVGSPGNYVSSPVVHRGQIFVGTPDNGFVCVGEPSSNATSETRNSIGDAGRDRAVTRSEIPSKVDVAWTLVGPADEQPADVLAAPALTDRDLVVPMKSEKWHGLVCLDWKRTPPRRKWIWPSPSAIKISPEFSGTQVVSLCGNSGEPGELVALDREIGNVLWKYPVEKIAQTFSADDDSVYIADKPGWMSCLGQDGAVKWRVQLDVQGPVCSQYEIITGITHAPHRLFTLDRISGQLLWQVEFSKPPMDSPVIVQDKILLTTTKGLDVRRLRDGSLLHSLGSWNPVGKAYLHRDEFVSQTGDGELIRGNPFGQKVHRQMVGINPKISPAVGADAILFADQNTFRLMRIARGASQPEVWFDTQGAGRILSSPILAARKVFVGVEGRGLICLQSRAGR